MGDKAASHLRLRELREERGWTQQEVADQIARLAWMLYRIRVGVNADMVAKWERGVKGISPRYRELLCLLFGVSAEYLGIGPATPVRPAAADRAPSAADHSLVTALGGAAAVLEQLGPAGGILQPRMFEAWKDDLMRRRALLKLLGMAPAVAGLPAMADADRRPKSGTLTPDHLTDLDQLADRYQVLYHSTPPAALLTPVVAHLHTLGDLLRQGCAPAERQRLLTNRARVATLAGRLAFFDLHDAMSARAYYTLALEAAREAGDHRQAAAALGHVAFIPAAEHGFHAALDYLRAAASHLGKHPHSPMASWLAAVESELHTNAGNTNAALAAVERAREILGQPSGLAGELPWFDYYNATRLAGFAGYATLRAGRLQDARDALSDALGILPRSAVKQRAIYLTDLATVELRDNDLDQACRRAAEAAEQLHQAGYAAGTSRLQDFRAAVDPWKTSAPVRALDEQLTTLV